MNVQDRGKYGPVRRGRRSGRTGKYDLTTMIIMGFPKKVPDMTDLTVSESDKWLAYLTVIRRRRMAQMVKVSSTSFNGMLRQYKERMR